MEILKVYNISDERYMLASYPGLPSKLFFAAVRFFPRLQKKL